jgi:DNA repair exonuclease SbcCD ATPase subunit
MRLSSVKAAGFRGIQQKIDIQFAKGFVVICGRNGSGKSTICDAIEFAICGLLQKHGDSSGGETISDYVWWRGTGQAAAKFVTVGFVTDDGRELSITRTPDGTNGGDEDALRRELCNVSIAPSDCLRQLCSTSLFRDDDITQLSVDMPESERFAFVKDALGGADFGVFENTAKRAHELVRARVDLHEGEYERERQRVTSLRTELSQASIQVSTQRDIAEAEESVRRIIRNPPVDASNLVEAARTELVKLMAQSGSLIKLRMAFESLSGRLSAIETPAHNELEQALSREVEGLRDRIPGVERRNAELSRELAQKEELGALYASLAQLHEHGIRVGLLDQSCPLCGSKIRNETFQEHLAEIKRIVEAKSQELGRLVTDNARANEELRMLRVELNRKENELKTVSEEAELVRNELRKTTREAAELGLSPLQGESLTASAFPAAIEARQRVLSQLEASIATLEASLYVERMAVIQHDLEIAQNKVVEISDRLTATKKSAERAKEAVDVIRRVSGEIVDDRLAELAPLLGELFLRLRPHVDWNDLSYILRGDVRRFLRLAVGDNLNPRFMFSSGQRRAVGLAFLLAVHMSRPWCRLRSLILDDPVQHIDDYRALHLVEVLSSIRQSGRQVICTVEDAALADLLCRRLRSSRDNEGMLIQLKYSVGEGVKLGDVKEIHTAPDLVLRSA